MLNTSVAPWPCFSDTEAQAAAAVIASGRVNYWTGEEGRLFEREFAAWVGTSHAVALANGTLALDLCLIGLGIAPGDEVIVTPRTFIASVSTVVNLGAVPVFADVDADSGNITPQTAQAVMSPRTRAIIPVHLGGWPCDMTGFAELAAAHKLVIVEDCAQAHGALHQEKSVGSFGHAAAWSFCQDKIMTTGGEGGMVTTSDSDLWDRMWSYKDHGKSWRAIYERQHPPGFRWIHESFGTNWRMLEVQAALGRIQLGYMPDWTAARTRNALTIAASLRHHDCMRVPMPDEGDTHAFYRLYAYVRPEKLRPGWSRDRIVEQLTQAGAPAFQGSCSEVYLEKAFDTAGLRPGERLPAARELGDTSVAFLVHPTITEHNLAAMCAAIDKVLTEASR